MTLSSERVERGGVAACRGGKMRPHRRTGNEREGATLQGSGRRGRWGQQDEEGEGAERGPVEGGAARGPEEGVTRGR